MSAHRFNWTEDDKLYLYRQCRRFAASNCPEEVKSYIEDVAHTAFLKAMKELPDITPEPGKTKAECLEALACLRVINEYRNLDAGKVRMVTHAVPLCPTDQPDEGDGTPSDSIVAGDSNLSLDTMFTQLDRRNIPDWLREFRNAARTLDRRDRHLVNALLKATDLSARRLANYREVQEKLHMSRREFDFRLRRLRRRFSRAFLLLQEHQQ